MPNPEDAVLVTLDLDWAPDPAIRFAAQHLIDCGVRATWFVTHRSPAIDELEKHPELFELGVHPNFLPGTTHGSSTDAVLDHCMSLVPEARSMRMHGLMQWTGLVHRILERTPIANDVSIFMPHAPGLRPIGHEWRGRSLLRVPYFWEDDYEMESGQPAFRADPLLLASPGGLKIFNFHPIHVYLNGTTMAPYEALKRQVPKLPAALEADLAPHVQKGEGPRAMFQELCEHLAQRPSLRIQDIHARLQR